MATETKNKREVMTAQQTKALCMSGLKIFKMNAEDSDLIDSFFLFKKVLNDLKSKLSKVIQERIDFDSQLGHFVTFTEKNTLADALDHFAKWAEKSINELKDVEAEEFVSPKGRDTSNLEVTLTGLGGTFEKKSVVPVHCGAMLKGSKLGEFCTSGIPEGFNSWSDLNTVLNGITTQLKNLIPAEVRKEWSAKRKPRVKKDEVKPEGETESKETPEEETEE